MGIDSKDLDVVIDIQGGAKALGGFLHRLFPEATSTPRQLGKGYPIWFVAFKEDVEYKGQVYQTKGADIDIAESQKEGFPDPDSRQRVVDFGTIEEDMQRRDFTVNQLMKDLTTGQIVDLSGTGVADVKKGILRTHPNVSPDAVFTDDPLRMMRLVRFMAKYGWTAAPDVVEAVKRNAHRIEIVSGERIQSELGKVMKLGKTAHAIRFMQKTGLLKYVMPEINDLVGVEQDEHYHAEGDVFEHTMLVLEKAQPTIESQLAALFHDAGKRATQEFVGDRIKFLGHEEVSGEIAEAVLRRLKYDNKTIHKVKFIVENHMRAHTAAEWSPRAVRKFIRETGEHLEDILHQTEIDALSSHGPGMVPKENPIPDLRERIKQVQQVPIQKKPVLDGREIMALLDIGPGPLVGEVMNWLQGVADEWAGEGKELSPEQAKQLVLEEFGA
jgi:poly(A) polymerase